MEPIIESNYTMKEAHEVPVELSAIVSDVWQTTHLDSMVGDLQRGNVTTDCTGTKQVDCELEAVPDLIRRAPGKKKRRPKPRVVPTLRVYVGTFVHSTDDEPLEILQKWMIGVDGGKILFSETVDEFRNMMEKYKLSKYEKECVIKIDDGSFMMPGFVDCHTHVMSYVLAGLRSKHRILDRANATSNDNKLCTQTGNLDDKSAAHLFTSYVSLSMLNGTTCAAYNGSVIESAARLLVNTAVRFKQRAMIGLEMFHGDNRDDTHMFQIIKVRDVVEHIIRKKSDRIHPCLILSKPLPDWLETKFSHLVQEMELPVKLTVGDEPHENLKESLKGWVELDQTSSLKYHKKHGLINNKSILVNCSLCSNRDMKMIAEIGCSVVYCPSACLADCQFSTLPNLLRHHINVGLGSDLNTSHSVSMLDTIRTAVQCSNLSTCWPKAAPTRTADKCPACTKSNMDNDVKLELGDMEKSDVIGDDAEDPDEEDTSKLDDSPACPVTHKELFRMATLGGAKVLGLDHVIGNFEVGKEFDALYIQPNLPRSKFVVVAKSDTIEDIVEKFIFLGDDRNISQVYIAGERIV